MGTGLLSWWRRRVAARGLAGAALFAVPVAVAAAIGFGTSISGVAGGLSAVTSGPNAVPASAQASTRKLNNAVVALGNGQATSTGAAPSGNVTGGGSGGSSNTTGLGSGSGAGSESTSSGGGSGSSSGPVITTPSPPVINLPGTGGATDGVTNGVNSTVDGLLGRVDGSVKGLLGN